jgi:hypothetical protein
MMCGGSPEFLAAHSDFRSDTIDPELGYISGLYAWPYGYGTLSF